MRRFHLKDHRAEQRLFARRATVAAVFAVLAVGAIKQAVYQGMSLDLSDALALERDLIETLFGTEDAKEGFTAFAEKRAPVYKGK